MTDSPEFPRSDFSSAGLYSDPTAVEIEMYLKSLSRDLTLASQLSEPMVDDDRPTVTMNANSDPSILPWQTDYRIELEIPNIGFVFASVMRSADVLPKPWSAYVAVNADEAYKGWHRTAEAARAAVENYLAGVIETTALIETDLTEETP